MFHILFYLMSILCSMIFLISFHPLSLGLLLMTQTFLICMISGLMMKTFWFSYILFLIFLGGMLVLFIYVISLASNEMFNFSLKMNSIMMMLLILMFMTTMFLDKYMMIWNFKNNELNNILNQFSFILENSLLLNKLYNFPMNLITIILMIYLFLTLMAIVKISQIFEGPLRPKK